MTIEDALKLVNVDSSEIIRDSSEEDKDCVVFGTYHGEQIDVYDNGNKFVVGFGAGRKNYKIYKDSGKVDVFQIIVA